VFFDVGANIGLYSLIAARELCEGGGVFSFEPDPTNFALLQRNIALNRQTCVIQANLCALGDRIDEEGVSFYVPQGSVGSQESSLSAKGKNMRAVKTPLNTIDNFCGKNGLVPSLIKIDTEGAEWPILQGGIEVIRSAKPRLIVEYHGTKAHDFGYTVPELWQRIEELGYSQTYITRASDEYFMTLCTPVK
jgi:FkbM family methyltransferase